MKTLEEIGQRKRRSNRDIIQSLLNLVLGIIAVPLTFTCLFFICFALVHYNVIDFASSGRTSIVICIIAIVLVISLILLKWEECKNIVQSNILIFVLLLSYVLFYHFWESLIGKQLVETFLCNFEANLVNDSIFIIAVVCCIIICFINSGKRIKQSSILIYTIAILLWVYYRWFSDSFFFISLCSFEYLKYIDIVPIFCLSKIVPLILKEEKANYYPGKECLIRDAPIDSLNKDELGRKGFAKKVIESILGVYPEKAFTYGIDGSWGAGKTSFINLMKEHISLLPIDYLIIDFNPWLFSAKKDIVTAFFDELGKNLKPYDNTLARNLFDYSKLLTAFDTTETKIIASLIDLNQQDSSIQEKKKQITDALVRIDRRIFVFIDDLDRLDADELLEMMKLIRNTSYFPNLLFVVAYDKSYLVQCLEKKMDIKGTDFVEKIFLHEFHLPPCPSEKLREILFKYIVDSVGHFNFNLGDEIELQNYIIKDKNRNNPLSVLSNIREVKRLANHFASSYSYVSSHINVIDLLLFELFKTKYSLVFSFFERKKDDILVLDNNGNYLLYDENVSKDEDDRYINFLFYIQTHHIEFNINDIDQRSIQVILESLFKKRDSSSSDSQSSRRFNDKDWFDRYINLSELESDITDDEFEEVMQQNIDVINSSLENWLRIRKTYSLYHHITNYEPHDIKEQFNLIRSVLYFISKGHEISHQKIDTIILGLQSFCPDYNLTETARERLMSEFKDNGCNDNICKYIGYLHLCRKYEIFRIDQLVQLQQYFFSKAIEKYENDSNAVMNLFRFLLGFNHFGLYRYQADFFNDEYYNSLFQLMQDYTKNHAIILLDNIITDYDGEKYIEKYYIVEYMRIIWGDWRSFYDFIIQADDQDDSKMKEFMEFYNLFEQNNYKKVYFDFKYITPLGMDNITYVRKDSWPLQNELN